MIIELVSVLGFPLLGFSSCNDSSGSILRRLLCGAAASIQLNTEAAVKSVLLQPYTEHMCIELLLLLSFVLDAEDGGRLIPHHAESALDLPGPNAPQ